MQYQVALLALVVSNAGVGPYESTPFHPWMVQRNWTGPVVGKWVHYLEAYERHFARFRGKAVTIVEIGLKEGGSLKLWRDYFGPQARIFGADVFEGSLSFERKPRYGFPERIILGDQGSESFWEDLRWALPSGRCDILIDDGSHQPRHMVKSMEMSLTMLNPGGVYVCEDAHGSRHEFMRHLFSRFVYSLDDDTDPRVRTKTLHAFNYGGGVAPNDDQQHVFAVSIYPYLAVVETMTSPRRRLLTAEAGRGRLGGSKHNWPSYMQRSTEYYKAANRRTDVDAPKLESRGV
tara:strand:+ start:761 stop:1630 length:870 start_codon:yes stop_codon:yes gene_type:complete